MWACGGERRSRCHPHPLARLPFHKHRSFLLVRSSARVRMNAGAHHRMIRILPQQAVLATRVVEGCGFRRVVSCLRRPAMTKGMWKSRSSPSLRRMSYSLSTSAVAASCSTSAIVRGPIVSRDFLVRHVCSFPHEQRDQPNAKTQWADVSCRGSGIAGLLLPEPAQNRKRTGRAACAGISCVRISALMTVRSTRLRTKRAFPSSREDRKASGSV